MTIPVLTTPVARSVEQIARDPVILAEAKRLSQLSNFRAGLAVARQWAVIAAAGGAAIWTGSPFVYFIAIVVIATRQHALGVLFHDASHYRLFSNRLANDLIADFVCALPTGMSLGRYRHEHLRHHKAPNTDDDPYWGIFQSNPTSWVWPKTRGAGIKVLLRDVVGINMPHSGKEFSGWAPWSNHFGKEQYPIPLTRRDRLTAYAFYGLLAGSIIYFNLWMTFLLLWALPLSTVFQFLFRVRSIAEHFALPDKTGTDATRHVDALWFERLGISPLNVNCHLTHHLFPGIPCYNLGKMTDVLFANPEFAARARRSSSYLGPGGMFFGELTSPSPQGVPATQA